MMATQDPYPNVSALDTIVGPYTGWSQTGWTVQQAATSAIDIATGGTYV